MFACGFFVLIVVIYFNGYVPKKFNREYFKITKIKIYGYVTDMKFAYGDVKLSGNYGMLYVNIIQSNTKNYDLRDSNYYYYCLIKNNKAELIQNSISKFQIGDTVYADLPAREIYIYRNNYKDSVHLNITTFLWKELTSLHRL